MQNLITINSRKFDNSIHRSWRGELLEETSDYWLLVGKFEKEISHNKLGVIQRNTISYEYYWKQKWFNIFRFHEPAGELKFYYCNINMSPYFENSILNYVDLDIDVLVNKDFSYEILDLEEFEENSKKFRYPDFVKLKAQESLKVLLKNINQRQFPFDCKNA